MKLGTAFFALFILICEYAQSEAIVKFLFPLTEVGVEKTFNVPLKDGRFIYLNLVKQNVDKLGVLEIKLNLTSPGVITYSNPDPLGLPVELYVEPESFIVVDLRKSINFSGALTTENELMLSLKQRGIIVALKPTLRPDIMIKMECYDSAYRVLDMLDSLVSANISLINDRSKNNLLSQQFIKYIRADVELYYLEMAFNVISNKMSSYLYNPVIADSSQIYSQWGDALTQVTLRIKSQIDTENSQKSERYFWCLLDYVFRYDVRFLKKNSVVTDDITIKMFLVDLFMVGVPMSIEKNLSDKEGILYPKLFILLYDRKHSILQQRDAFHV
jgi:hypothetical protein